MAVAFDASSSSSEGTGNLSWTHTPVGTPRGVVVLVVQTGLSAGEVSGVTYGGVAMTVLASSGVQNTSENGFIYGFFLGASIPTGAQTVVVSVSGGAAKRALAASVTASADTEIEDEDTAVAANPSIALTIATESMVFGALHADANAVGANAAGTNYQDVLEHDFGSQSASWIRRSSTVSTDDSAAWSTSGGPSAAIAVAITEAAGGGGGGNPHYYYAQL